MFASHTAGVVCAIRDAVCPRAARGADGFYDGIVFNLTLRGSSLSPARSVAREAAVLLCGDTQVFTRWSEGVRRTNGPWLFAGAHTSCWRDVVRTFLNEHYFEMADLLNPDAAPADLDLRAELGWLQPPWCLVRVKTGRDETDPHGYRRFVAELQPRA